ncbi:PREDICTED: uncharacterized protein LOC106818533, partial [Priapulus caudatus]|uniref:Uncharacterized protein LOC106818533 n=1 Tax=Priapulus caudatus TaxID=37621 RepID=A0ABM1F2P7_PRICU
MSIRGETLPGPLGEETTSDEQHYSDDTHEVRESTLRRSERTPKPSIKVQENCETQFWELVNNLNQSIEKIDKHLQTECSVSVKMSMEREVLKASEDLDKAYEQLRYVFPDGVPSAARTASDRCHGGLMSLLDGIRVVDRNPLDFLDKMSIKTSYTTSSKRALLAAKAAALQVELEARQIESQQRLDLARLEAREKARQAEVEIEFERRRREIEEKKLEMELKKTETEMKALEQGSSINIKPAVIKKSSKDFTTQKHEVIYTPAAETAIKDLTKSFSESLNLSRLPAPEPFVFDGEPLNYPAWKAAFSALIDHQGISPREKIHYLRKYLSGEARESVEGLFYFDTKEAYLASLKMLEERYGNPFLVAEGFRNKIENWPRIQANDSKALRKFTDFLRQCLVAIAHIPSLEILNDCRENRKMLTKLPDWMVRTWSRIVTGETAKGSFPSFEKFVTFLTKEADIACNPVVTVENLRQSRSPEKSTRRPARVNVLASEATKPTDVKLCIFCDKPNHNVDSCRAFGGKTPSERREFLMKNGLCFGCLRQGHLSKKCPKRSNCGKCQNKHPTILHGDYEALHPPADQDSSFTRPDRDSRVSSRTKVESVAGRSSMILPVYLSSQGDPNKECLVYALLDTQSDTTFVLEEIGDDTSACPESTRLKLSTMTSTSVIDCHRYTDLQIRGVGCHERFRLPVSYSRSFIPVNKSHIPTPEVAKKWPHLENLSDKIAPLQNCEVALLIGYDCPRALAPMDVVRGTADEPFGLKTELGWTIVGRTMCATDEEHITHRVLTKPIPEEVKVHGRDEVSFVCRTKISEEITLPQIVKILESDFQDKNQETVMSQDDLKFLQIVQSGIHQDEEGFYEMPLPFRDGKPTLPDNKVMVMRRLDHLRKRFKANSTYYEDYRKFMDNVLQHRDAEEVASEEADSTTTTSWYIPHHGVYNPKKPEKIRVVFDCSARYKGACLNDHLLRGPDLINSLIGVLCRFREKPVAVMGDVERMFHQFRVNGEDRDFLRFLWFRNGDMDQEVVAYRMKVHLFGATSSPGCANFGLKKLAADHRDEFSSEVCDFLTNDFYVDDGLKSCATTQEAIKLVEDSRTLCATGNLRLHKFTSNNQEVLRSIPESERAKDQSLDMSLGDSQMERVLGIHWSVIPDQFCFRLKLGERPLTRRGVLSAVASVYDPLGCLAPFVLRGKWILQQMCKEKVGWDDPLSESLRPKWEQWVAELPTLEQLQIPRCLVPEKFGDIVSCELHHFSDASVSGYGQCSYLRLKNQNQDVHCALVMGKARVCPLKVLSIPRLELAAALVSAKISSILRTEMTYANIQDYFWTDSKVVLGYINNDARRFHVYVANRVQQIQNVSEPSQWRYVESANNPADHASRGLHVDELIQSNWLKGPAFLWNPEVQPEDTLLLAEDPEVRRVIINRNQTSDGDHRSICDRLSKFSNWRSAVNAVAVLVRYVRKDGEGGVPLVEEDRQKAVATIIKSVQKEAFGETLGSLGKTTDGRIRSLDPFIDSEGVLRVGGRLSRSTMKYGVKHPIILPNAKSSHVVGLIVMHHPQGVAHQGRGFTINALREHGYWIIGCSRAVSSLIYRCVTCRKLRGSCQTQKMAQLPEDRIEPAPPFTYCGIDCFGPFVVKDGRRELKRYGLL